MNREYGTICRSRVRIGKRPSRWNTVVVLSVLVITARCFAGPFPAQSVTAPTDTTAARPATDFDLLVGQWVRPDGCHVVTITRAGADGKLVASYANPDPLPFSRAEAMRDGNEIRVFLELTAGGYNGSTYTLVHDPVRDVLGGVYYQAVTGRRFDIYFERAK